jgi:hypothetical protein
VIGKIQDLIAYLAEYHKPLKGSPALDPATVPQELPNTLRELYCGLGALIEMEQSEIRSAGRAPFSAQDTLVPLRKLKRVDGMVEFAWENQGCWSCRTPVNGEEDPPVYSDAGDCYYERPGFLNVCDKLSHFLITLSLQEAVMSSPVLLAVENDSVEDAVAPALRPLWLNGKYVFDGPTHNIFDVPGHDILIMRHLEIGIWVASHSKSVFELLKPEAEYDRIHNPA